MGLHRENSSDAGSARLRRQIAANRQRSRLLRLCALALVVALFGVGGCDASTPEDASPFIGKWTGTVVDSPFALEFRPDGEAVLGDGDTIEITGTYEYAANQSVALIKFAEFPAEQQFLSAWFSDLHAEMWDEELSVWSQSVRANASIRPAASAADVESFMKTVEADERVTGVDLAGPEGYPRVEITLRPDASVRVFAVWLRDLPEYVVIRPAGEDSPTLEGALGDFTRVEE